MGTTANGLPYPESTDQVKQGAVAIKNLADALQLRGSGLLWQAGSAVVQTNSAGGWGLGFGRAFSSKPAVLVSNGDVGQGTGSLCVLGIQDPPSTTAVSGTARNSAVAGNPPVVSSVIRVNWLAVGPA